MNCTSFKRTALVVACGMQVLLATAQDRNDSPYLVKTFPRDQVRQLRSQTSGGNIHVSGQTTGDAKVVVYVRSNNGNHVLTHDEAQQRMDESVELTVAMNGGTLEALAKRKGKWDDDNWRHGVSVSFEIYVPEAVSSDLETSGGNIHLNDLTGTENFSTSGGNLHLEGLSGKINGTTSGGNVTITDSKNDIDLRTSGGNMHAKNCEGTITLTTSGGNMDLQNVKGTIHAMTSGGHIDGDAVDGELKTSTSGGNIHLDNLTCSLNASTSGGSIDVTIKKVGKYVELGNSGGNIHLTLPNQGYNLDISGDKIHTDKLNNFSGTMDNHNMNGTLNGGGIPVRVSGNSGHVTLTFE
ncbi:MAG TPA: hypothetical protein VFE32_01780 [Puia sp.]|nr:hypothetical protein [Puia sp.]